MALPVFRDPAGVRARLGLELAYRLEQPDLINGGGPDFLAAGQADHRRSRRAVLACAEAFADLVDDEEDEQRVDQVNVHAARVPRRPGRDVRPLGGTLS